MLVLVLASLAEHAVGDAPGMHVAAGSPSELPEDRKDSQVSGPVGPQCSAVVLPIQSLRLVGPIETQTILPTRGGTTVWAMAAKPYANLTRGRPSGTMEWNGNGGTRTSRLQKRVCVCGFRCTGLALLINSRLSQYLLRTALYCRV